jgi:membrane protease YdiL (CAAX protease family)
MTNELNFEAIFKSKKHALWSFILCIIIILTYKYYKFFIRQNFLPKGQSYIVAETYYTFFRVFSSILGIAICSWAYKTVRPMFKREYKSYWLFFFFYLGSYFLLKFFGHDFATYSIKTFSWEVFFNLFTGISEEYLFRGLLLGGIAYFIGTFKAAILSSFIFTIWHIDVTQDPLKLTSIFFFSLMFSQGYRAGYSLFGLAIIHFVIDQIHFGFKWTNEFEYFSYSVILLNIITIITIEKTKIRPL